MGFYFYWHNLLLGYLGAKPIEEPFLSIAFWATIGYFSFFFIVLFDIRYYIRMVNIFKTNKEYPRLRRTYPLQRFERRRLTLQKIFSKSQRNILALLRVFFDYIKKLLQNLKWNRPFF